MQNKANLKYETLEAFINTINDLGIELMKHSKIKMKKSLSAIQKNIMNWRHVSLDNSSHSSSMNKRTLC